MIVFLGVTSAVVGLFISGTLVAHALALPFKFIKRTARGKHFGRDPLTGHYNDRYPMRSKAC